MSKRIMNLILNKKHESWVESIQDQDVQILARNNTIITGGCIASMLLKEEIKDFDFYFTNFETCKTVAEYYVQQFIKEHDNLKIVPKVVIDKDIDGKDRVRIRIQSADIIGDKTNDKDYQYFEGDMRNGDIDESLMPAGEEYVEEALEDPQETLEKADEVDFNAAVGSMHGHKTEKGKFRPIFLSDNAVTLSDKVQLVIRFYGEAEEVHRNFDYLHCVNYWRSDTKELVLKREALESLLLKRLYYMNSLYPICALIRIRKFIKRGWIIDAGQMLKICFQISKLNLNDFEILQDQLLGIDTAYFQQLINFIRTEKSKDENWILDLPYLVSIIDKIF